MIWTADLILSIVSLVLVNGTALISTYVSLSNRITALETKIEVFWKNVSYDAARVLHSPDPAHARMDELIERYLDGMLTAEEVLELKQRLKQKVDDHSRDKSERMTASVMLNVLRQRFPTH